VPDAEPPTAVEHATELGPAILRRDAEERFSIEWMARGYLEAYETMRLTKRVPALSAVSAA
jgi:hypothetical protein